MIHIQTMNPQDTEAVAHDLAQILPCGAVVLLTGDLGVGKTVFARAMVRALAGNPELGVASPTFNLVYTYDTSEGPVAHFDLYRLKNATEVDELGFDEALAGRLTIVEWPDRLGSRGQSLKRAVTVNIAPGVCGNESRRIDIDVSSVIHVPQTAFVFAAGLGNRMKPLTDQMPKPLVPVNGRPMLDYIFDALSAVDVGHVVMNTHYLPEQIVKYADGLRGRFDIKISHEPELLDTGGGMKAALPLFDDNIFFAFNGDSPLFDRSGLPILAQMAARFDPDKMDILLLMQPNLRMITEWAGNYVLAPDGAATRALGKTGTHMFNGTRVMHRRIFEGAPDGKYSFSDNIDVAMRAGRLFGFEYQGDWHNLSSVDDVRRATEAVQAAIKSRGQVTTG